MTHQQLIDELVSDLLSLEPGFKEEQVRLLVAKFLANRPVITPDDTFREELYQTLLSEIKTQSKQETINPKYMFNKFKFTFAALAAVAVLFVITTVLPKSEELNISSRQEINRLASNAFGELTSVSNTNTERSQSGGGSAASSEASAINSDSKMAFGMGGGGGVGAELSIAPYVPYNYKFVYTGDEFTVEDASMAVYQRQKGFGPVALNSFLERFNVGLLDISRFANANLDYITASQNTDFGYVINLDLKQGSINLYENWEKWQTPDRLCREDSCFNQHRLTIDKMPDNATVIATAVAFLDEFGINRDLYGEPVVQDQWRIMYANATDKSLIYLPDSVNVVFPFKIGDNEVFDQSGYKSGLNVSVNVRVNRVSNVYELSSQKYDSSDYATEQDTKRLIGIAENGGYQQYIPFYGEANVETKILNLGTPSVAFVRVWQYMDNTSRELFVPSLIFPIENLPTDMYMQNITVPLITSLLDAYAPPTYPLPVDLPIIEPAR